MKTNTNDNARPTAAGYSRHRRRRRAADVRLAVDLGAESGRVHAARYDGNRLSLDQLARFPNPTFRRPNRLRWDIATLYEDVLAAIRGAAADGTIASVGVDSWGVDFGLLDAAGTLIASPLHHREAGGTDAVAAVLANVSRESLYETTGSQLLPFNTLFQLAALRWAGEIEPAERLLLIPDLLAFWLCGSTHAEATNASTTQLVDLGTGDWAWQLLEQLAIPARLFPPLVEPGTVVGPLVGPAAEAAGPVPLVAVATHDTASAVVATPLATTADAYISSGTWSVVGLERDAPLLGAAALAANVSNERGFAGTTRALKNVTGLWLVQACRRAWSDAGDTVDYASLTALATQAPADGPLFDPDEPELIAADDMPSRIAALCVRSGQSPPRDRAALLRSIFESLACKYRYVLDELAALTNEVVGAIHVVGGGAQNGFLCQLTADVTGLPVLAGPVEATALGNALVQLHAFGEVGSLAEMRDLVRRSFAQKSYEPSGNSERWQERYETFRGILTAGALEGAAR